MRNYKRIAALLLAIALVFSVCVLAVSCSGDNGEGNNGDKPETPTECTKHTDTNNDNKCDTKGCDTEVTNYTVTVKDSNSAAVKGATVKMTYRSTAPVEIVTDENGKASYCFENNGSVTAEVTSVSDDYYLTSTTTVTLRSQTPTAEIRVGNNTTFTVTLKYKGGDAISNVLVQLCQDLCQTPKMTDANGQAVFKFKPIDGIVKAAVTGNVAAAIGADYKLDGEIHDDRGVEYIYFPEGETNIVLEIVPVA